MAEVMLGSSNGSFQRVTGWGILVREEGAGTGQGCFVSRGGDIEAKNSVVLSRGDAPRGTIELNGSGIATFGGNTQAQITIDGTTGTGTFTGDVTADNVTFNLEPNNDANYTTCLLYTSPSPRDRTRSRMPSSA